MIVNPGGPISESFPAEIQVVPATGFSDPTTFTDDTIEKMCKDPSFYQFDAWQDITAMAVVRIRRTDNDKPLPTTYLSTRYKVQFAPGFDTKDIEMRVYHGRNGTWGRMTGALEGWTAEEDSWISFPRSQTNQPMHASVNTTHEGIFAIFAYYGEDVPPENIQTPDPRGDSVLTHDETGIIYEASSPTRYESVLLVEHNGEELLELTRPHMSMAKYEAYRIMLESKGSYTYRLGAGKLKFPIPPGYSIQYCTILVIQDGKVATPEQRPGSGYIAIKNDSVYRNGVYVLSQPPRGDVNHDNRVDIDDIMLVRDIIFGIEEPTAYHMWAAGLDINAILLVRDVIFGE